MMSRQSHSIGWAVVRAPPAVGAGVEIEHVLPGEVFELLHPEGFHPVQMLIADAPSHGLDRSPIQLCEAAYRCPALSAITTPRVEFLVGTTRCAACRLNHPIASCSTPTA